MGMMTSLASFSEEVQRSMPCLVGFGREAAAVGWQTLRSRSTTATRLHFGHTLPPSRSSKADNAVLARWNVCASKPQCRLFAGSRTPRYGA